VTAAPVARAATGPAIGSGAALAVEPTEAGAQTLVPGIAPITGADRLRWRADAPLAPSKPQQPCEKPALSACLAGSRRGLFDLAARAQLDLFIHAGD
jgi:hypothetical protein